MKYSPEFIQKVQEANNLVDIIAQYTVLKPAGGGLMGRCPFPDHPERTPSFSVSEAKQVYNCFGCHKKGNIFSFLEQYNGMSFRDALEYLAERAGITLPKSDDAQSAEWDRLTAKKREILRVNRMAMEYFASSLRALSPTHAAKAYLQKRGLNTETITRFKIGFASAEWDGLLQNLRKQGVSQELLLDAKLVKMRSSGDGSFDLFRNRIMFPILDNKNEVIGFGGRALADDDVKYLNSPETPVFSKSKTLYGVAETAKYIRTEDYSLVVEGYMDLVTLFQFGFCTAVAPMGTALTVEQAKALRRLSQNVIVLFDGDDAGQSAAEKSLPILLASDLHARGVILPEGLDPDEYVRAQGSESLLGLLQNAEDLFTLILQKWTRGVPLDQPSHKIQIVDRLRPLFSAISDPRLHDLYLDQVAALLGLEKSWIFKALSSKEKATTPSQNSPIAPLNSVAVGTVISGAKAISAPAETEEEKISLKGATKAEELLLQLALRRKTFLEQIESESLLAQILHPGVKKIIARALTIYRQNPSHFDRLGSQLVNSVIEVNVLLGDQQKEAGATSLEAASEQTDFHLFNDVVAKLRERFLRYQAHQLKIEMGNQTTMDAEKLQRYLNLHRERLKVRDKKEEPKEKETDLDERGLSERE